jgi:hypothetical protein
MLEVPLRVSALVRMDQCCMFLCLGECAALGESFVSPTLFLPLVPMAPPRRKGSIKVACIVTLH